MKMLISFCMICLPLKNLYITSSFGYRRHPLTGNYTFHNGIDFRARSDTVYAIMDGVVSNASYDNLLGVSITLNHQEVTAVYGHLSRLFVTPGESIQAGQPIGITGGTGRVTGEHLHFSIRIKQQYIDPMDFFYQNLTNRNHE
ncbi:M23 family metallopeptidase [Mucilaginibacter sp. UYCu711]|uniref:M23 family metallopeptidase n=1 Tax=Mucilaginibacter sp. UYCu711 TaxID=3156339 RepID=UPI003D1DDA57